MIKKEFIFEPNSYPIEPGLRLIEASAGTGKTFSLAHLVLRLLTEKEHSINQILVVSFTRATSSEIKSIIGKRILSALKSLESWEKGNHIDYEDSVLEEWVNKKVEDSKQCSYWASLLLEALDNLDHADITTIHGFCNRTLKREAIESGSHINPILELDHSKQIQEIAHEYWTNHVLDLNPGHVRGIQKAGFTLDSLTQNLQKIDNDASLDFKINIPNLNESLPLTNQFNNLFNINWLSFCLNWEKDGAILESDLINYAAELRSKGIKDTKPFSPNPRKDRHEILTKWVEQLTISSKSNKNNTGPFYEDILNQKEILGDYYHPINIYKLNKRHNINHYLNLRPSLLQAIESLWDGPAELIWSHGLAWCTNLLAKKRLESGTISNRDLIKALDPKKTNAQKGSIKFDSQDLLFEKLRSRYKIALIDEFQDTDPVQWRLLKEVFGNSKKHLLLMVGDPKQAIYKFRGGDLNTYIKARGEVDRIDALLANFRTTPTLIKGLNSLISTGLIRSSLKTPSLIPKSKEKPLLLKENQYPLQLLDITNDSSSQIERKSSLVTKSKLEERIPNIVANHLLHLLDEHKKELGPADICILVNTHNQAELIRKTLEIAGLPSRLVSKGNVFKTEAAHILQLFLNCLATPGNTEDLKLIASSELINWNIAELEKAEQEGGFDQLSNSFQEWCKRLGSQGLLGCLSEFLEGKTIARLSGKGRLLSDLNQCAQLVEEEIHRQGFNAQSAAQWLKRQRLDPSNQSKDVHQPNSDVAESAINLITIHRSKGLQYKVVICPYLWQCPPLAKGPLWRKSNSENWLLNLSPGMIEGIDLSSETENEARKEYERLAYVALTRAQKHLVILWGRALKQEGNPLISFLFGPDEINSGMKDLTHQKMLSWLSKTKVPITIHSIIDASIEKKWVKPKPIEKLVLGPTPKRLLEKSWGRYSYSSWIANSNNEKLLLSNSPEIEEGKDIHQRIIDSSLETTNNKTTSIHTNDLGLENALQKNNPFANFPRGTAAGDCLHRILEKIDFQNEMHSEKNSSLIIDELRKAGLDLKLITLVQSGLDRVLNIPLGGALGKLFLKQVSSKNRIHEMKFDLPLAKGGKPLTSKDFSKAFHKNPKSRFGVSYAKYISQLNFVGKGFLTGSIDMVFADNSNHSKAKWWILDWKSNWIGILKDQKVSCGPQHYDKISIERQMLLHHYPLQAHIYLVALHRLLKWRLPNYSPNQHLGGYVYMFIRGIPEYNCISNQFKKNDLPGLLIENAPIERVLEINNIIEQGNR